MAITLTSLRDVPRLCSAGGAFDTLIDVRAPAEFAEDHVPGAINLPVLDDAERARVGTVYKQVNPFTARKLGAALVARNAAAHLEGALAEMPGGWKPLVYCWRGGQRSGSFASILSQIGWRVETVAGGYKSYRSLVVAGLQQPVESPVVVLDGNTGTAKTEVLALLAARGVQVVDLEGLAHHRGSLFGGRGGQPSQKAFEGALAAVLAGLDPTRPVVVEAESSKVGDRVVPARLWAAMCAAPRVTIAAALEDRAAYLCRAYGDVIADSAELDRILRQMVPLHAAEVIDGWRAMAAAGAYAALAQDLMARHYDPRYAKSRERKAAAGLRAHKAAGMIVTAGCLSPVSLDGLAGQVAAAVQQVARAV